MLRVHEMVRLDDSLLRDAVAVGDRLDRVTSLDDVRDVGTTHRRPECKRKEDCDGQGGTCDAHRASRYTKERYRGHGRSTASTRMPRARPPGGRDLGLF